MLSSNGHVPGTVPGTVPGPGEMVSILFTSLCASGFNRAAVTGFYFSLFCHADRFLFKYEVDWLFSLLCLQLQDNKTFLAMINHVLSVDGFYFSTTYDLTHTLQRLSNTSPEFQEMSLLERVSFTFGLLLLTDFVCVCLILRNVSLFHLWKYILIFLSPGFVRIMYGALKTYHVSNIHHNSKFRTLGSVHVTQTGLRTLCVYF